MAGHGHAGARRRRRGEPHGGRGSAARRVDGAGRRGRRPAGIGGGADPRDGAGLRAPRPDGRRPHPRPLPRRERGGAHLDGPGRLALRDHVRGARGPATSASTSSPDGLDTVATVELNGAVVGRTANMHRSYRFDVAHLLRAGRQHARRHLRAPAARRRTRRAACSAGARTSTPTRTTRSARWPAPSAGTGARTCRPPASGGRSGWSAGAPRGSPRCARWSTVDGGTGRLTVARRPRARRRRDGAHRSQVAVGDAGVDQPAAGRGDRATVEVDGARRPRCGGRAGTAPSRSTTGDRHAATAHRPARRRGADRVGFRTVTLDTDARRARHAVHLRGQRRARLRQGRQLDPRRPLPHPGHPRAARARGSTRRSTANMNLLRVWGGGIYESDDFYDVCDELGVLVWQDFLFACAAYAEEEPLRGEVEAEARENVTRLSPHPASCSGTAATRTSGATRTGAGRSGWTAAAGASATTPSCCPASSPSSTPPAPTARAARTRPAPAMHPNDPDHGTTHHWDVWNRLDYTALPRRTSRGSAPSSASRGRPPGPR